MYTAPGNAFARIPKRFIHSFHLQLVLIALALLAVQHGYGQSSLPLHTQLQNARQDTTRLRLFVQLANTFFEAEQFDSLYAVTQRAIPLAAALKATQQEGQLYYLLSRVYRYQRASHKTLETLRKTVQISRQARDLETQAKAMYLISTVYGDLVDYKKIIDESLINLDFFRKHHFSQLESYTYSLLCDLYRDLGDKKHYAFYINKAIQQVDQLKNPSDKTVIYLNIAQFYEDEGNDEKAWTYLQKALVGIKSPTIRKSRKIPVLTQAATNLRKRHQLKKAMAYLEEADRIRKSLPGENAAGIIYYEMALVHVELKNYQQALQLMQTNVDWAKSLNLANDISANLKILALVQEKMGKYEQALQSFKEYHFIVDSLRTVEKSAQVAKIQTLYELEKKENTILSLQKKSQFDEQKLELADRQRLLYLIGIGSLTVLSAIVGYFLRRLFVAKQQIEEQAQQLKESNRLKDRLFAIIGHDLRSPVASIKNRFTLLKLQNLYTDGMSNLEHDVNVLSQILDNILYWALNQQNGLKLQQRLVSLNDLVDDVLEGFTGFIRQKQLAVTLNLVPVSVWTDEHMTALVLRNILHNACKFTPVGGRIHISTIIQPNQSDLRIADTGIGITRQESNESTSNKGTGIGLALSKDLMVLNGGQLTLESQPGEGTEVTLSWPQTVADEK